MVGETAPYVIGVEFGLFEESGDVVIVEVVLDLVVFSTNRLHQASIA